MLFKKVISTLSLVISLGFVAVISGCGTSGPAKQSKQDYRFDNLRISMRDTRAFNKAVKLMEDRNYQEAADIFKQVITDSPQIPAPYINLAIAYEHLEASDKAEEVLLSLINEQPNYEVGYRELGAFYRRQGQFSKAQDAYDVGLRLYPNDAPLLKNAGILCDLYLQDLDCALDRFSRYIAINPSDTQVPFWIADIKRR